MMTLIVTLMIFISVFQGCITQWEWWTPWQCTYLPIEHKIHPMDCCRIPQLFPDEDFMECGMMRMRDYERHKLFKIKGIPRESEYPVCNAYPDWTDAHKLTCLFERHHMNDEYEYGIIVKLRNHFRKVAERYPKFKRAVQVAIKNCFEDYKCPLSMKTENFAQRCLHCFTREILKNCPNWQDTSNCSSLQWHVNQCRSYSKTIYWRWGWYWRWAWGDAWWTVRL